MSGNWEVFVWDGPKAANGYGNLLGQVPGWTALSIAPLGSDPGAGTITVPLASPLFSQGQYTPDTTPVLAEETLWQVKRDGTTLFEFLAETVTRNQVETDETATVTISGPGTGKVLNWAMAMPTGWTPSGSGMLKTGSIEDQFSTPNGAGGFQVNQALWNHSTAGAVFINTSGTVTIDVTPAGAYLGGGPFDMTGSSFSVQATPVALLSGGTVNKSEVTQLIVRASAGNGYAMIALSDAELYAQFQDNTGTVTTHNIAPGQGSAAATGYANGAYAYWRISCDVLQGNVRLWRFWTSGDGSSWALQWSVRLATLSFNQASVNIFMGGEYSTTGATANFSAINGEVSVSPAAGPIFVQQPILAVMYQLILAAQARGTIPFVTPTFGLNTDSGARLYADKWSVQAMAGTDLLSLMVNYAGAIDGDWIMKPGYQLNAGIQGSLGGDKTSTIVFHEGEVTLKGQTETRDQIFNVVATTDGAGVIHTTKSAASAAQWGQRETMIAAGGTLDPVSAAQVSAAGLAQLQNEVEARVLQIPPNQPGKTVFTDFQIFDWVGIERGDFANAEAERVVGITVGIDQDGAETHELILQTYRQALAQYFLYLVNKLGGQTGSTLGALPGGVGANGIPVSALGSPTAGAAQALAQGTSSAGLITTPSLGSLPEIASGGGQQIIPGTMIIGGTIPQSALSFTLASGVQVTFSSTAPANPNTGDLWYNTAQGNTLYQYSGTQWVAYQLGAQAVSFSAQQIGGITVFVQGTAPTGTISPGSLWYDSGNNYRVNVYTAGAWAPFQFGTGALAAGSVTAAIIAAQTITAANIATGTITAQQIAAATITANNIAGGTITATQIAAGAITAGLVAAGAIDGLTLNGNVLNAAQVYGDFIVLSGANDGVFCYGQPPLTVKFFQNAATVTTWTGPPGVTGTDVYMIGSGGGSGNGTADGGGGGGGGGIAIYHGYPVAAGNPYYVHVGSGGTPGNPGTAGGDTWFNTVNAEGGVIGFGGAGGNATGGAGAGGGFQGGTGGFTGGAGGTAFAQAGGAGGGGGGAGSGGPGGNALNSNGVNGGRGGGAGQGPYSGGPGGSGGNTVPGANGGPGSAPGGGGGGAGAGFSGGGGGPGRGILVYQASASNLIASLTGLAGVDPVNGTAVPQGLMVNAVELTPRTQPPVKASSADAVMWATGTGVPMAATGAGWQGQAALTATDSLTYSTGNSASQVNMTKAWTIPALEMNAGTCFIIEFQGGGTWEVVTGGLTLGVSLDGGSAIARMGLGGAFFSGGQTFNIIWRVKLICVTAGATGQVSFQTSGMATLQGGTVSSGASNNDGAIAGPSVLTAYDTTASHTVALTAQWGATATGLQMQAFGSTATRLGGL